MIRPTRQADVEALLAATEATGFFKPLEIETLGDVFYDFFDHNHHFAHRTFAWEEDGQVRGFVYYALEDMTDRTWYLWWIAVEADQQGRGLGGKLLAVVEEDLRKIGGSAPRRGNVHHGPLRTDPALLSEARLHRRREHPGLLRRRRRDGSLYKSSEE